MADPRDPGPDPFFKQGEQAPQTQPQRRQEQETIVAKVLDGGGILLSLTDREGTVEAWVGWKALHDAIPALQLAAVCDEYARLI